MATYGEWREVVLAVYNGGEATRSQVLTAIKDGTKAIMARDTEGDLQLSRSYRDRFDEAKVQLAGAAIDDDDAIVIAAIRALMPVEADTDALSVALDNAITTARDDFNQATRKFDEYLLQAVKEIQSHVAFYQVRQLTPIVLNGEGVIPEAFYSRFTLPEGARVQQLWYGKYYPALEAGVPVEDGDFVVSNGRVYKVITGGTPTEYDVADGLTTTDGTDEELSDMVFRYYAPDRDVPVRKLDWTERKAMRGGDAARGPCYTQAEESDELWLYPGLDADHRFDLEWVGIADEFEASDEVTFDRLAAEAAAHYVRSQFAQNESANLRGAGAAFALFQRALRKAVLHHEERERGTRERSVVPYNWARCPTFFGSCCVGATAAAAASGGICEPSNGWDEKTSVSGDTELSSTAANMHFDVTITDDANLYLSTEGREAGDRMTVTMTLPSSVVTIAFRNGALDGGLLLPDETYTDQIFTTDGITLSAVFEFFFDGNAWQYSDSRTPA